MTTVCEALEKILAAPYCVMSPSKCGKRSEVTIQFDKPRELLLGSLERTILTEDSKSPIPTLDMTETQFVSVIKNWKRV
ncbi:hypothetical protein E2P81_ATG01116 [Venturia nashicola]|uniref:Uncharacterized protein n=1 Tax=Venturia nashicola TaxID=86259 RepID=A0A4Z1PUH9_9PEZI|nr:hypothetical protein E6O75_ATG01142 [Venturia nashicola]TLD38573.1 hypothetical protein E2P81_ATG01116 [Venturia nashicola]